MIPDSLLLLAICIPTLLLARGPLQSCAGVILGSFVLIAGFEKVTGGYAVDNFYIIADLLCTTALSALLLRDNNRVALTILAMFWVCNMIHGLKLIFDPRDLELYWWVLRVVNFCQLVLIGGAGVIGTGKRYLGDRPARPVLNRDRVSSVARIRRAGE
jgi:hypothetical protein